MTTTTTTNVEQEDASVGARLLRELRVGEVALAIHHSGAKLHRELSDDEITVLVGQGAAWVGVERLRLDAEYAREVTRRGDLTRHRRLWGSRARYQLCVDLAWQVSADRASYRAAAAAFRASRKGAGRGHAA
ncbi:hypothetical protein [Actinokineospora iranica]|uniref:Uncharacterized protein n=1 Tax=Actinokineospora iranica TaxID=1271860 RepID=A0A1G6P235_9PSEU|nr:hypothetical protein [Actinokineospora iranica]SDC74109.1 hypothetical protein SAMN05216174_10476 [Actinokineospora iranica]